MAAVPGAVHPEPGSLCCGYQMSRGNRVQRERGFFPGGTSAGAAGSDPTWKRWLQYPSQQDNGSFSEAILFFKKKV